MEQRYRGGRMSAAMARKAAVSQVRHIHEELAGRYGRKAAAAAEAGVERVTLHLPGVPTADAGEMS